ncbi:MAG: endonuclease/exonuclease/phosphatase family protein, partial [Candidatus Nanopelagicales bacterium]
GAHPHHGPLYGVALMSRVPVAKWQRVTFAAPRLSLPLVVAAAPRPRVVNVPDEPRVAIAAEVPYAGGVMTVATAHLSFVPGVNVRQLKRLVRWLEPMPRPLVLMGDFNLPGALPEWLTGWDRVVDGPTYPSVAPRIRFDHILLDGFSPAQVSAARRSVQILPLGVSDHCAVIAELPF